MTSSLRVINLTSHEITVYPNYRPELQQFDKSIKVIFNPSGSVARCVRTVNSLGHFKFNELDLPIEIVETQDIGLNGETPPPQSNTLYIVSAQVAAYAERDDFIIPMGTVFDNNKVVVGCSHFAKILQKEKNYPI